MNRSWILLLVAALVGSGCGGSNGSEAATGDGGEDGSGDATADGTQGGDGATTDSGADRSMPSDSGHDAADASVDQSTSDAPSDRAAGDAPADQSTVDAPPDTSGMDAPADVVTGCNATTCPHGCCTGTSCTTPSATACGTAGAACMSCGSSADGCSASGACTCGGGTACSSGQVCSGGKCICDATSCPTGCCLGSTCEPGTMTAACGPAGGTCQVCATGDTCTGGMCVGTTPVCGNGVREAGEQCDDGNQVNLDGCDHMCQFEQITRATQMVLQWMPDSFCTADKLLQAIKDPFGRVHAPLQSAVNSYVTAGTDNVVFKYFAITDLTGTSGTVTLGSYNATLTNAYTTPFNGNSDLDWWYTLDPTTAGASPLYTPTAKESAGTFTNHVLSASGGHVLVSAFGTSLLDFASVKLQLATATPATTPTASTGASPGHLATENIDPMLTSFATAGGTNTAPTGLLCGNTTAASLALTPVPSQFQTNCTDQNFTGTNNMLDVFVDGCSQAGGFVQIIATVQPDQVNPDAPPVGAGGLYTFQLTGNQVTGCKDKSGTTVNLAACEAAAAYSTYLKIAVDRVILKHP